MIDSLGNEIPTFKDNYQFNINSNLNKVSNLNNNHVIRKKNQIRNIRTLQKFPNNYNRINYNSGINNINLNIPNEKNFNNNTIELDPIVNNNNTLNLNIHGAVKDLRNDLFNGFQNNIIFNTNPNNSPNNNFNKSNFNNILNNNKNLNKNKINNNISQINNLNNFHPVANVAGQNNNIIKINVERQNLNLSLDHHKNKLIHNNNLIIKKSNRPKYFNIFKNFNIFNSVLIALSNISSIMNYFSMANTPKKINNCEKINPNCLTMILYHIYNLLWNSNNFISEKELIIKYNNLISNYYQNNCLNNNYFSEIKNSSSILGFIFEKINFELTVEKSNNFNNVPKNFGHGILSEFKKQFYQKNKSIISDNFIGIFKNKVDKGCLCSKINNFMDNNNNHSYSEFYYINFDLNEIKQYYLMNENKQDINLDNCFYYTFIKNCKKQYHYDCYICFQMASKFETKSIFSLPNILSLVLSNNSNNNFIFQEKLNLKKYCKKIKNSAEYYLISIICRFDYNGQFAIYCFNPNNGYWYCYLIDKIIKVKEICKNAIPIILFYQLKSLIPFEYNGIKKEKNDPNEIKLKVKFNGGFGTRELSFNKYIKIKEMRRQISYIINIDINKFFILINGIKSNDEQILKDMLNNYNNDILVWIKK